MSEERLSNPDLEPTTEADRTWDRWHIAALWVGMAVCIPTYTLASGMVSQGWSWKSAVLAVALGNLIVLFPMLLNAHAGAKYGIPFPILLRSSFGILGSNIPAMMRAFVACGWFGIQTWIGGSALYRLWLSLFPNSPSLPELVPAWFGINTGEFLAFVAFWLLNVAVIAKGMDSLKKLEVWAAPFLLLCGAGLLAWAWSNLGSWTELLAERGEITRDTSSALLGAGLTSGVAFWGTLALNIPDFARYAKNQKEQIVGQALGLVPTMTAFAWIGAVVTNATVVILGTKVSDPVALVSQLGGPFLTVLAMVGLIIATLSTNLAANVVSPANDFSNLAPKKISFKTGALIAATVGMVMMPWKLYIDGANYLFTWLIGYGGMLGAVAGIMLTDYYLIRKCSLNVDALYVRGSEYEYSNGFNWIAVLALCLGISVNLPGFLGALGVIEVGDFARAIYERAWFAGVFISAFTYWAGMKFLLPAPLFNRDVSISNAD